MKVKFRKPEPPPEFQDVIVWAAWLYYVDQMTQSEVARELGVSRASVVNYLQEARDKGIVSIQFDPGSIENTLLSQQLRTRFGLEGCTVIPRTQTTEDLVPRLGKAAARTLSQMLQSGDVIGVAWGKTVLAAAQSISRTSLGNLTVVQVVGSIPGTVDFSPELCTSVLANQLNARCMNFLAPAVLSSRSLCNELLEEEVIANQFQAIRSSRIILFGIGDIAAESTVVRSGFMESDLLRSYEQQGAVGTIIGRMLNAEGEQVCTEMDHRMIGLMLEEIRPIPCRLAVAGGIHKLEAIRATLRGGYVTHLVIDFETASALI
ncbi:MAG: sugar-binding transcriptional regulator [bacterium]|jgi:DNA-binding transcriptional regulator LsrR (DeoR family)